jgi:hypothetical protein
LRLVGLERALPEFGTLSRGQKTLAANTGARCPGPEPCDRAPLPPDQDAPAEPVARGVIFDFEMVLL